MMRLCLSVALAMCWVAGAAAQTMTIPAAPGVDNGKSASSQQGVVAASYSQNGADAGAYSYGAVAGDGCADGKCGHGPRTWRDVFSSGCANCPPCGPAGRVWFSAEYLYWWTAGDPLPALVTTSTPGTADTAAGVLGLASTQALFPTDSVNGGGTSGLRLGLGAWIDRAQTFGIQAGYIQLVAQEASFFAGSDAAGNPILARPFNQFNTGVAVPAAQLVAFPGIFAGSINVSDRTEFDGWDVAFRANMCCGSCWRLDGVLGYRHLRLTDRLQINNSFTALAGAAARNIVPGTQFVGSEFFSTSNEFHGADAGITGEYRFGAVSVIGLAKAAFGYNNVTAEIGGTTSTTLNGVTNTSQGNLLALQSNIGTRGDSHGTIIPELGLNLGWDPISNIRLKAGYSFLYLPGLFRPSGQIDQNVNTNLLPPANNIGPANPAPSNRQTDMVIHGITAGFELRY